MATKKQHPDPRTCVLVNIPLSYDAQNIKDYVEGTLDIDVKEVKVHSFIPGRALVRLKEDLTDWKAAAEQLKNEPLEGQEILLLTTHQEMAVVISDIDLQILEEEYLRIYLEDNFADEEDIIKEFKAWPELKVAVVRFDKKHQQVVEAILEQTEHIPLQSENYRISIDPFYSNFHNHIGQKLQERNVKTAISHGDDDEGEEGETIESDSDSQVDSDDLCEGFSSGSERDNSDLKDTKVNELDETSDSISGSEDENKADQEEKNTSGSDSDKSDKKTQFKGSGFRGRGSYLARGAGRISSAKNPRVGLNTGAENDKKHSTFFKGRGLFSLRGRGSRIRVEKNIDTVESYEEEPSERSTKRNTNQASLPITLDSSNGESEKNAATSHNSALLHKWRSEADIQKRHSKNPSNQSLESSKFIWNSKNNSNDPTSSQNSGFQDQEKTNISISMKKLQSFPSKPFSLVRGGNSGTDTNPAQKPKKLTDVYDERIVELEEDLKKLSEENARLKEKPKETESKLQMSSLQAKLLQPYFSTHQSDCLVRYATDVKTAIISGPENLVKEFQIKLMMELRKIKEETIKITKEMLSVLNREKGKNFLMKLDLNGALTAIEDDTVKVAALDECNLSEAVQILNSKLDAKEVYNSDVDIPPEKFDHLKMRLEVELLVHVILDKKEMTVIGIRDDVGLAQRDVKDLLEEIGHFEKVFEVGEPEAKFFHLCLEEKMCSALRLVEVTDQMITDTKVSIKFKGQKNDVFEAFQILQDFKKKVKISKWNLREDFKEHELLIIGKSSGSDKKKIETVDYKNHYLFTFHIPEEISDSTTYQEKMNSSEKLAELYVSDLIYDLSSSCKFVIKSDGNITREKSDIIVSLLGREHDMRKTAVGKAINSFCPQHYKDLKVVVDSDPGAKVMTVKNTGRFKCMAICHIVLHPWDRDAPGAAESQLTEALKIVFSEAKAQGAKSVSFPAIGCGRAFRFSPSRVAELFLQSLKAENVETFLEKIVILASEKELYDKLKQDTLTYFKLKDDADKVASDQLDQDDSEVTATSSSEEESDSEEIIYPIDVKHLNNAQITIFTLSKDDVEDLKEEKKKFIREQFLHVCTYKQNVLTHWSKSYWGKIIKESIRNNVWVEQKQDAKTKNVEFHLTGQREGVLQVKNFIHYQFLELTKDLPKRSLTSSKEPQRGTLEFMKFVMETDDRFPSYWSLCNNKRYLKKVKERKVVEAGDFKLLVDVDKETKDAIENMMLRTMEPGRIGHGADAQGINYTNFKVIAVQRVENPELFDNYRKERERLFRKMIHKGHVCDNIGNLRGAYNQSKGDVATAPFISRTMQKELYCEINEHYLFHGAKEDTIQTLINSGLDPRVSNDSCMFGKGIYTAEKSTKADQYADVKGQRVPNGTPLKMILTRLLLGNVFLCDDSHKSVQSKDSKKLSRPPCMNCSEDLCGCENQLLYDSVLGDGKWIFREFVVYHSNQCYPEYVITYQRV